MKKKIIYLLFYIYSNLGEPGTHWSGLFLPKRGRPEWFDSFNLTPSPAVFKQLKRYPNIKHGRQVLQGLDSDVCARYVIFYIACRMGGYKIKEFYNCFGSNNFVNDHLVTEVLKMF